jgi:phage baseplate assembly protein W
MAYIRSNRVDPRDFQINTAIGVALPFNAPGVFNSIYSTQDQIKYNLINLILTSKGERIENPNFGTILKQQLFEQISDQTFPLIRDSIVNAVEQYLPEIAIDTIDIVPYADENTLVVTINYRILLSARPDSVTINLV